MSSSENPNPIETKIGRSASVLIFGRLALIFLLLLVSWWWTGNYAGVAHQSFPEGLLLLFLVSIALSVIYFFVHKLTFDLYWLIRGQLFFDVLLISWLVAETGYQDSPFITLYLILISVAGYFVGRRETLLFAIFSSACLALVSLYSGYELTYTITGEIAESRFGQSFAFNIVGILIVGLLAGHLSERRIVTEQLRAAEESFRDLNILHGRIVESIRSGLITTDLSGKIRTFNNAAEEISHLRRDDAIGGSVYTIFGDDIRPAVDRCLYRAAEGHQFPTEHFEAEFGRPAEENGSRSPAVACSVAPLIGKTGMVNGLILSFQDITDIRTMERSLRRSDRLAAIGRMAAGLAHEIRNPLGSMSSALQFLEENVEPQTPGSDLMGVVLRESDRLNEIISNFLTYAQLTTGGAEKGKLESIDLCDAIRDCLALVRHSPEIEEFHLIETALPDTPVFVNANGSQIKQVLWNLFQNAIHAMPDGGKLTVSLTADPGNSPTIVFEDNGIGIEPENLEHLFEPFHTGTNGTGLGLSIVHQIIRAHGGKIGVTSELDVGTIFTVELPH